MTPEDRRKLVEKPIRIEHIKPLKTWAGMVKIVKGQEFGVAGIRLTTDNKNDSHR